MQLSPINKISEHTLLSLIRYRTTCFSNVLGRYYKQINKKGLYVDINDDKIYKKSDIEALCDE